MTSRQSPSVFCELPSCDRPRGHESPHGALVSAPRPDQPAYLYEELPIAEEQSP